MIKTKMTLLAMLLTQSAQAGTSLVACGLSDCGTRMGTAATAVLSCAPEVAEGNTSAAVRIMGQVAKANPSETKLVAAYKKIVQMPRAAQAGSMLKIAGVNPTDVEAISEFIGTDDRSQYVNTIQQNLDLSNKVASELEAKLTEQLKGQLQ